MPADFARERMIDELTQSSAGRTIMTTEPKFVPEKAVKLQLDKSSDISVRLVDCVGYLVNNSIGYESRIEQTQQIDSPTSASMPNRSLSFAKIATISY